MAKGVNRLFEQFHPERYDVFWAPDRENKVFTGKVTIVGKKVGRPSKRLVFHQKDLKIVSVKVEKHDKKLGWHDVIIDRTNTHNSFDELRLHSPHLLYPAQYRVYIEFSGKLTDSMHGMYPSYYTEDGVRKSLIATQFESHHAREALPCIDEPEAKAVFQTTIRAPKADVVLSNTPAKNVKATKTHQEVTFEETPIMSSYLLAFVMGDMHNVAGTAKDGTEVKTWSTKLHPKSHLNYANQEAIACLDFFTEYFDTPFPLNKCDQVALPDFESGAMENWGLITYREIALIADPINRSLSGEQHVSMVVAHEMSHQWFGNLVTMKWWDDIWLNESFAGIMEHVALDKLHPDWHQWEQYMISDVMYTTSRDVYKDVQPVKVEVKNPAELFTLFDPAILYVKGGRLIRMLIEYVGEDVFCKALKQYFKTFAYKNTTRDDLWGIISHVSGLDIHAFMDPWLNQSGMPVLEATADAGSVSLAQHRLLMDGEDARSLWPIPLLSNQNLSQNVLETTSAKLTTKQPTETLFNTNAGGHYIVHYKDADIRHFLAKSIAKQSIASETRANILNDLIILSRAGETNMTEPLDIIANCTSEPRDAVWGMFARTIGTATSLTEGHEPSTEALRVLRRKLAAPLHKKLGWDAAKNEDANTTLLRLSILGMLIAGEEPTVIDEAQKRFTEAKSLEDLPTDLRPLILIAMIRHGKENIVPKLTKLYQETANPELQLAICSALTEARNPKQIADIITGALGEGGFVRPQDIFRWFAFLMRNHYARDQIWEWLISNWSRLEAMMGGSKAFDDFPVYAAGPLNTEKWLKQYSDFFTPKLKDPVLERNIRIGLADISARAQWRKREEPLLREYLKKLA
jgi:aminopeptidase N